MIELIDDLPRNVVGISVKGRVTKDECRESPGPGDREVAALARQDPAVLRTWLTVSGVRMG